MREGGIVIRGQLKSIVLIAVLIMVLSVITVGCNQKMEKFMRTTQVVDGGEYTDFPTKPINVIVPYPAGGGTDVGARTILPYVEKELGVPLNVINKSGNNGWAAWGELLSAKPDGYTIGYIITQPVIAGYLNPDNHISDTIDSFDLIANHVTDYSAIAIRKGEKRFQNMSELIKYAKQNELTVVCSGFATDDHVAVLRINNREKTKLIPVLMDGGMQTYNTMLKGYVDVYAGNVGEIAAAHKKGDVKIVAVMAPERVDFLLDVPSIDESSCKGIYVAARRGLAGPKGIDPAVLKKITDAFVKAMRNEEYMQKMQSLGLKVDIMYGDGYKAQVHKEEREMKELAGVLGW